MQGQNSLGQWYQLLGLQTPKDNLIKLLVEENKTFGLQYPCRLKC